MISIRKSKKGGFFASGLALLSAFILFVLVGSAFYVYYSIFPVKQQQMRFDASIIDLNEDYALINSLNTIASPVPLHSSSVELDKGEKINEGESISLYIRAPSEDFFKIDEEPTEIDTEIKTENDEIWKRVVDGQKGAKEWAGPYLKDGFGLFTLKDGVLSKNTWGELDAQGDLFVIKESQKSELRTIILNDMNQYGPEVKKSIDYYLSEFT